MSGCLLLVHSRNCLALKTKYCLVEGSRKVSAPAPTVTLILTPFIGLGTIVWSTVDFLEVKESLSGCLHKLGQDKVLR